MTKIGQYIDNLVKKNHVIVAKFSPLEFDNFLKILSVLPFSWINIRNQELTQEYENDIYIKCSFKKASPNNLSISCVFGKGAIKLLKKMIASDKVYLLQKDDEYTFTNGNAVVNLESYSMDASSIAVLPNLIEIQGSSIHLNKLATKTYNAYLKKITFAELIVYDNVPAAFRIENSRAFVFKEEFISEYSLKIPSGRYLSESMPLIQGKEITLSLLLSDKELWLKQRITLGLSLYVDVYEKLTELYEKEDSELTLEAFPTTLESDQESSSPQ